MSGKKFSISIGALKGQRVEKDMGALEAEVLSSVSNDLPEKDKRPEVPVRVISWRPSPEVIEVFIKHRAAILEDSGAWNIPDSQLLSMMVLAVDPRKLKAAREAVRGAGRKRKG